MSETVTTLRFSVPWAPSVNHYWQHVVMGGKFKKARAMVFLSDAGKRYRTDVMRHLAEQQVPRGAVKGRLAVHATAYPPDRRARDLDNVWKGLLDALRHAGVIADDEHIDDLHIVRGPVRPGGCIVLKVAELGVHNEQLELPCPQPFKTAEAF